MRVYDIDKLKLTDTAAAIAIYNDKKSITVMFGEQPYRIAGMAISGIGESFHYTLRLKQCDGEGRIVLDGDAKQLIMFSYNREGR